MCEGDSGMTIVEFAKLVGESPEDYCDSSCEQCECGLDSSVPMGDCDHELSIFPYNNAEYCQECVMLQISYRDELDECQAIIDENVIPIMVENDDLVIWLELVDDYPKAVSNYAHHCNDPSYYGQVTSLVWSNWSMKLSNPYLTNPNLHPAEGLTYGEPNGYTKVLYLLQISIQ